MALHAGHGLTYHNVRPVATIEGMHELNIGHSIVVAGPDGRFRAGRAGNETVAGGIMKQIFFSRRTGSLGLHASPCRRLAPQESSCRSETAILPGGREVPTWKDQIPAEAAVPFGPLGVLDPGIQLLGERDVAVIAKRRVLRAERHSRAPAA